MEAGVWFVSVYNDQQKTQTISFKTDLYGKLKGGNLTLSMLVATFVICWLSSLWRFANSLDPDQDRQNVGPDLDSNHFTLIMFLKEFFEDKKGQQMTTKA